MLENLKTHLRIMVHGTIYLAIVATGFLLFLGLVMCVGWCYQKSFWYPLIPIMLGGVYAIGLHLED